MCVHRFPVFRRARPSSSPTTVTRTPSSKRPLTTKRWPLQPRLLGAHAVASCASVEPCEQLADAIFPLRHISCMSAIKAHVGPRCRYDTVQFTAHSDCEYNGCRTKPGLKVPNMEIVQTSLDGTYACADKAGSSPLIKAGWHAIPCTCSNAINMLNCHGSPIKGHTGGIC